MSNKKGLVSDIQNDLLLEAIDTYKTDLVDEAPDDEAYEEHRKEYKRVAKIHKKLANNKDISSDLTKDNIGCLVDVLDYYIPIREEDLEYGLDDPQAQRSQKVLPRLRAMRDSLAESL